MNIDGQHYTSIWLNEAEPGLVEIIDQRKLPHEFIIEQLRTVEQTARAIREMHLRGAPLIGAAAAYGMYQATLEANDHTPLASQLNTAAEQLKATRPTAVDLAWAVDQQLEKLHSITDIKKAQAVAKNNAIEIAAQSAVACKLIGVHGLSIIESIWKKTKKTVNVLTHCNAGWLACVDYGTATSPIYAAHDAGIPVHVWVDETRPRNQGARLTAWELSKHGVPHTIIADNTGGHLMQHSMVDCVIVGSDRTTRCGDVANKIGTYLKALAAYDNQVPFYVTLPSSTIDFSIKDGLAEIPIEQRGAEEVKSIRGKVDGQIKTVAITPSESPAVNFGFDVTPARLVTSLITERGICAANEAGILSLYPEHSF